jgi:hypothetical protein
LCVKRAALFGRFDLPKYRVVPAVCDYVMLLPLLKKAKEQSPRFLLTPKTGSRSSGAPQRGTPFAPEAAGIPQRALLTGGQSVFFLTCDEHAFMLDTCHG